MDKTLKLQQPAKSGTIVMLLLEKEVA